MSQFREAEEITRMLGARMKLVSEELSKMTGRRWGFALMLFAFDGDEFVWTSNANRADMVKAMQEFIRKNPPDQTSADRS